MGSFANTLFTIMLGWIQTAASTIWSAFTTENGGSFLQWVGKHWIVLAVVLCAIGLIVDLGVYLARWRPLAVWRSFFQRLRHKDDEPEEPIPARETYASSGNPSEPYQEFHPRRVMQAGAEATEQADFSRWEEAEPEPAPAAEPIPKKPTITGAGYIVPADSPYRRPAEPVRDEEIYEPVTEEEQNGKPEIMTQRKRRRRLIVSDLFNDPEEDLYPYEAPQQLIDKNKAYHQPVYPRNWKKDEEQEE
jgi:hypothetical protein